VGLRFVPVMFMIVLPVFTGMPMVMNLRTFAVDMLMAVLVNVFMRMRVSVLVTVFHITMAMLVRMGVFVIVSVKVLMFVLSFHGQNSLQEVDCSKKCPSKLLRSAICTVNVHFFRLHRMHSSTISMERLI